MTSRKYPAHVYEDVQRLRNDGRSDHEIAMKLGIPASSVWSILHPHASRVRRTGATEEQIAACMRGIRRGMLQTEIGKGLGLGDNSMVLAQAYGIAADRLSRGAPVPRARGLTGRTTKGRLAELNGQKKNTNYANLIRFQTEVARLCVVLEDYDILRDLGLSAPELWTVTDLYDDLLSLSLWLDRALSVAQGYLQDKGVRDRIEKLREAGGRTPEEAESFERLAKRLEAKLDRMALERAAQAV